MKINIGFGKSLMSYLKNVALVFIFFSVISCKKNEKEPDQINPLEQRVLFEQPTITDLNGYVSIDPNDYQYMKDDQMLMTSYSLHRYGGGGSRYDYPVTDWDIGKFTGVASAQPFQKSQIGLSTANGRIGSTAFQAAGDAVGAINAPHLFPEVINAMPGTLIFPVHPLHVTFSQNRRIRPFADNRKALNMSFEAKMPFADAYGTEGIAYLGPNFTIRDVISGTIFHIGAQIWDSRGVGHEGLMVDDCDKCSGNVMVPTILSKSSKYITLMEGSSSFRGDLWDDFEYFGWSITRNNFIEMIKEIKEEYPDKELSDNLDHYELVSFLLGTEVILPSKLDKYSMGVALKNFKVTLSQ